jgi:predicted nuclease of predicted toxin-antitoxin system
LSLHLYLDECAYSHRLVRLLRDDPWRHDVQTPVDAGSLGRTDPEQLAYARSQDRVLVTKNPRDFEELHQNQPDHLGILVIYQDNLPSDMSAEQIAQAIGNLEAAGLPFNGCFYVLNAWNY